MAQVYKAKWILTSADENSDFKNLYEDAALVVENGVVTEILPQADVYDEVYETVEDFGNGIITPAFFNLNANLQYKESTGYKKLFVKIKQFLSMLGTPMDNYAMKLSDIEAEIVSQSKDEKISVIKENLKREILSGTSCILQEIKIEKFSKVFFEILNKCPLKTFFMIEVNADSVKKSNKVFQKIKKIYKMFNKEKGKFSYLGLNPQSVWAVHKKLWRFLGRYSRRNNLILMTELLESQEEVDWLNEGFSYLNYYNKFRGNKNLSYPKGYSEVAYLKDLKVLGNNVIIKNGNYLNSDELKILSENNVNFAFSPTLNKKVFEKNLSCEAVLNGFSRRFGLMTGMENKSVLEELFEMTLPLPIEEQIKYITLYPAKMLGLDNITGSLEYNKHADFNVFKLDKKQKMLSDLRYNTKPFAVYVSGQQLVKDGEVILL